MPCREIAGVTGIVLVVLLGCSQQTAPEIGSEQLVIGRLAELHGRFEKNPANQAWIYSDTRKIEEILRGNDPH